MAHVFNLANYWRTQVIDLIAGTFKLVDHSWATGTTDANLKYNNTPFGSQPSFQYYQPVAETFNLWGDGTAATLLPALKDLQDVCESVRQFHAGVPSVESWWLEWNADGESARRALIYTMTMDYPTQNPISSPFFECGSMLVKIGLTRHPLWENVASSSSTDTSVDNTGGIFTIGKQDAVEGTAPARMEVLELYPTNTEASANGLHEHWIGIRPTHQGYNNFTPLWECEAGTNGTDATDAADATASGGNRVTVSFATSTALVRRMYLRLSDIAAWAPGRIDYQGRYLVLARMKVTAGTIGVQMRSGYSDNIIHEEIYADSTNWYLHELGEIAIPPWSNHLLDAAYAYGNFQIGLYAERLSGAGSLYLDCLVLVPSEHLLYLHGTDLTRDIYRLYSYTLENDTYVSLSYAKAATDIVNDAIETAPLMWYIPQEGGILVYAGQYDTSHALSTTVSIAITFYPRWLSYRYDEAT